MTVQFAICPDCGALPCDWGDNPSRNDGAYRIIADAVAVYGKPGGPWNVPSDPGGWLDRARNWLAEADGRAA